MNTKNFRWYAINTWQLSQNANENLDVVRNNPIYVASGHRVGIGTDKPGEQLEVVGNIKSSGKVSSSSIETSSINTTDLKVTMVNADNIETRQNITAKKFSGEGITPPGEIIMYSGSLTSLPSGWAICDGNNEVVVCESQI